jgi:hypothetical protein
MKAFDTISDKVLVNQFNLLLKDVFTSVNEILEAGISIPTFLGFHLKNSEIKFHNGYLEIGTNPKIEKETIKFE